jgi:putative hemolysin
MRQCVFSAIVRVKIWLKRRRKMKSKWLLIGSVLAVGGLVVAGCARTASETKAEPTQIGMANPASVYCEEQGYTLEMRTGAEGVYGVCIFPDGSECDEWAYFRGECEPGSGQEEEVPPVNVPDPAAARDAALATIAASYGDRVSVPQGDWTEENITKEGLVGSSTFRYTSGDWEVTVSFPVVNPVDTIFQVVAIDNGSGFRWEGQVDAAGQVIESSVSERTGATFEGISFFYDDALAAAVVPEVVPAVDEGPYWATLPAHVRFSFEDYALPEAFHEPQILVFSAEDMAGNDALEGIAAHIAQVLAERPDIPVALFQGGAILPPMNAGHMVAAQVAYFDFQNGTGVRFVTQMGQAYYAINNRDLFYTFQGMTHDGKYYVAAILPISHPSLPADGSEIPGGDPDAFADNFDTYSNEVAAQLNAEAADSFAPSIVLLDEMMQSLNVTPTSAW